MKIKKYKIILMLFLVLFLSCILIIVFNFKIKERKCYFFSINENLIFNDIIKKCVIILKDNTILIGRNKKEIDNFFVDIKIEVETTKLKIQINKLFKDIPDQSIYSEEYLIEILNYVEYVFKINFNIEDMKEEIKNIYLKVKDINIESVDNVESVCKNEDYSIKYFEIDNNLLLEIEALR